MTLGKDEIAQLLTLVTRRNAAAKARLTEMCYGPIRAYVAKCYGWCHPRLPARLSQADVVQEAVVMVNQGLSDFARANAEGQCVSFSVWVRGKARDAYLIAKRAHVNTKR